MSYQYHKPHSDRDSAIVAQTEVLLAVVSRHVIFTRKNYPYALLTSDKRSVHACLDGIIANIFSKVTRRTGDAEIKNAGRRFANKVAIAAAYLW